MDKNRSVATLQIVGGHPSLDFANTVAARRGHWGPDVLVTYDDLLDWAARTGLFDPDEIAELRAAQARSREGRTAALERAKRLREALYETGSALAAGSDPPAAALALLREEFLAARRAQGLAGAGPGLVWRWAEPPDLERVAHRVAVAAVELLTGPDAVRVKECLGPHCGWLFLDTTRNRSRRWCSDADCGTRDRVARHRRRMREEAGTGG